MDQKKIGTFLKELRKEKSLTQGQLAEQFDVSDRTVSRWENGNNMPDLSLLIEMADYYQVDIREILNGERKSENMNKEEKETLQMVADYAENEKNTLLRRLRIISIIGVCSMIIYVVMELYSGNQNLPVFDFVQGASLGFSFGALLTAVFYSTGLLSKFRKVKENARHMKKVVFVCVVICVVLFLLSLLRSL